MRSTLLTCLLATLSCGTYAVTSQTFHENADLTVSLSNNNYNRLVVKNDKIIKAHFPEGTMIVKGEEDGSLYVMAVRNEPFTLFLTTEGGHHLSATVNSENALGKTIEFVPQQAATPVKKSFLPMTVQAPDATNISDLMTNMMSQKELSGFSIRHHYGRAIRLQQGLVLLPKLTYLGAGISGEVFELYNGSSKPIDLVESWFAERDVKAVALSETTLAPKQSARVYRVVERRHG